MAGRTRTRGRKACLVYTKKYSSDENIFVFGQMRQAGAADADSARVLGVPCAVAAPAPSVLFHDTKEKIFLTLCNEKV